MSDPTPCRWQKWRVRLVARLAPPADPPAFVRPPLAAPGANRLEQPGPDGIRHALVARIRREIAAGSYDTEARWLAAEEALLQRCAGV